MDPQERDPYDVLGIRRDADARTIKRAFRTRTRRMHPDVSWDPDAGDRFTTLVRAYGVLSQPGSRLLYDRVGWRSGSAREPTRADAVVELEAFEAERGTTRRVNATSRGPCPACGGSGSIFGRDDATGASPPPPCLACDGCGRATTERTVDVDIPAGARDGTVLRVAAGASRGRDRARDLHVHVRVLPERDTRLLRYASAGALVLVLALFVLLALFPASLAGTL